MMDTQALIDFLKSNPDEVLQNHHFWDTLIDLYAPDAPQETPSLLHKQIALLKQRNDDLKARVSGLLSNGSINDNLFHKTENAILSVTQAKDFSQFLIGFERACYKIYQVFQARLIIFSEGDSNNDVLRFIPDDLAEHELTHLASLNNTLCGPLRQTEKQYLFGNVCNSVKSSAIVPLKLQEKTVGLLAFGSNNPHHFSSEQDTLFIDFFGKIVVQQMLKLIPKLVL